jgi:hypothetical protein
MALGLTLIVSVSAVATYARLHKGRVDRLVVATDKATEDLYQEQERKQRENEREPDQP